MTEQLMVQTNVFTARELRVIETALICLTNLPSHDYESLRSAVKKVRECLQLVR